MRSSRNALFIIGSFFVLLIMLVAMLGKSTISKKTENSNENQLLAETDDLLVTRQLSQDNLLPEDVPLVTFIDPQHGNKDAPVVLVEFSDFACPFCKDVQSAIAEILKRYPDDVRHVWKDAPNTSLHPESMNAHLAARCAQRQQKFWEYHDALFNNQEKLNKNTYEDIARALHFNVNAWKTCFEGAEERAKVERGLTEAKLLNVDGTPYFFINNERLSGAVSFEELNSIVSQEIINAKIQ